MNSEWITAIAYDLHRFLRIPLRVRENEVPGMAKAMLPVAGGLAGLAVWCFIRILTGIGGHTFSILAAGLLVPLLMEMLTGWTGFHAAAAFFELRRRGVSTSDALSVNWSRIPPSGSSAEPVIPLTVYLFRCGLYAILAACGHGFWFLLAWAGAFYVQAELMSLPDEETNAMFLPHSDKGVYADCHPLFAAACVFLLTGAFTWHLFSAVGGLIAVWGLGRWFVFLQKQANGAICPERLAFFGFCTEVLILLLGIILN